jgi:branched-chain amino acid transport system substrate-binding protein
MGNRGASALRLGAVIVACALLLTACGGGGGSDSGGNGPFTLGYTGTLSGSFASYAQQMQQGVNLAVEELNRQGGIDGQKIEVEVADDKGKPENGPVIARQFCGNDSIRTVLGYSFSSVALAAVPSYSQCRLPVVASAVTSPDLSGASPYFFRTVLADDLQGKQMGNYAVDVLGYKRIATLYQVDDYGEGVSQAFNAAVEGGGGEVLSTQGYQLGTTDFSTQLNKIKNQSPEAIFIGGFYPEASKIAQQARELGMNQQILGTDGSLSPQLIDLGGDAVDGMIIYGMFYSGATTTPEAKEFVTAFKKKYNEAPSSWAALAYDAVYAVKHAAEQSGGSSREDIKSGLEEVNFEGVSGDIKFNSEGDRVANVLFLTVENGQFKLAQKQIKEP